MTSLPPLLEGHTLHQKEGGFVVADRDDNRLIVKARMVDAPDTRLDHDIFLRLSDGVKMDQNLLIGRIREEMFRPHWENEPRITRVLEVWRTKETIYRKENAFCFNVMMVHYTNPEVIRVACEGSHYYLSRAVYETVKRPVHFDAKGFEKQYFISLSAFHVEYGPF